MRNLLTFEPTVSLNGPVTPRSDYAWTPLLPVIGLLGGVASGKSLVASRLKMLGAGLLDGDRAGHRVLCLPEVEQAARQRWGASIFGPDGRIMRAALARVVFAPSPQGPIELHYLEQLTHPQIGAELRREAAHLATQGTFQALVLDAPVMLKAGWSEYCSQVWFVDAPRDVRLARALARGWSQENFVNREAAQEPVEEKRRHADVVIDNSGSPEQTFQQVDRWWQVFLEASGRKHLDQ